MKNTYISTVYDLKRTPKTDYPVKFVEYLIKRFNLKPHSNLLEIGCGRCDFLLAFSENNFNCIGVDKEIISLENNNVKLYKVDIKKDKLPFADETFDVVYHKSVIEHFYSPDNLMQESLRVLKKGGKLIVLTPDWISQMQNFYEDYTHSRPYTVGALKDLFVIYNLKNAQVELFYQLPIVWKIPQIKIICKILSVFLNSFTARKITEITKIKFFRWAVELMIIGYGEK